MSGVRSLCALHYLYLAMFVVLCALFTLEPVRTYEDFWAHASVGRWIWQEQEIPRQTLFLWTSHEPWIAHSWLGGVVLYGVAEWSDGGNQHWIILGFRMVMVLLPFVVLWLVWQCRAGASSLMMVVFVFAIDASRYRFQTRPELFTSLFFAVLLAFLVTWHRTANRGADTDLSRRDAWSAVGILMIFVLWVNCHGAVALGLLLFGVTVACDLVQDRFDRRSRALAILGLLTLAAVQINPYGIYYWQALRPVGGEMFGQIAEWQPFWMKFDGAVALAQGVLLAVALAAWCLNSGRRWAQLAWLVVMVYFFVTALRNSWLLALTSLAVIAANAEVLNADVLWRRFARPTAPGGPQSIPEPPLRLRWLVRVALLAWMAMQIHARLDDVEQMQLALPKALRDGGIRFLQEHPMPGKMLNDYDNSAYLQWCLAGSPPLYIDVLNAYPDWVFLDLHADISKANQRGRRRLDEHDIGYVFLATTRTGPELHVLADYLDGKEPKVVRAATAASILALLASPHDHGPLLATSAIVMRRARTPEWVRVYAGYDSVIWVRRTSAYENVWRHPQLHTEQPFAHLEMMGRR